MSKTPPARELALPDPAATEDLARCLAPLLEPGDLILVSGALGAGKTTLVRSILAALGEGGDVPSPTFSLALVYADTRIPALHADLYRVNAPDEIDELGLEDFLQRGVAFIEWPDRLDYLASEKWLAIGLRIGEVGRSVRFQCAPAWRERLDHVIASITCGREL